MEHKTAKLEQEVIEAATQHIREQKNTNKNLSMRVYCTTLLLCIALICATIIACVSIVSQQKSIQQQQEALNAQYAQLMDYMKNTEIIIEESTAQSDGDGSISIAGDGNVTAGGDMIGE